jgi:RIO-like serine/threonine protein kinase
MSDLINNPLNKLSRFGCSYDDRNINCEGYGLFGDQALVVSLDKDLIDKIEVGKIIGRGTDATVYHGQLDEIPLALKIGKIYEDEICIQHLVSQAGLAPKIYSFQKCSYDRALLIMDEIDGQSLSRFIAENNDCILIQVFLTAVKTMLYLGVELLVEHGDLHKNNIFITYDHKVILIDFGVSIRKDKPTLNNYLVFIEEFYNTLYPYIKYGKIPFHSNATQILYALNSTIPDLYLEDHSYIELYNQFEEWFLERLPEPLPVYKDLSILRPFF